MSEAWASNEINGKVVMARVVRKPDGQNNLALGSVYNTNWLSQVDQVITGSLRWGELEYKVDMGKSHTSGIGLTTVRRMNHQ